LSPSSILLLLAKTITHPAARSLCVSWASCFSYKRDFTSSLPGFVILDYVWSAPVIELLPHGLKFSKVARRMFAGNVFCLCALFLLFDTQTLPPRWTRCHQNYITGLVLGWTRKIHSHFAHPFSKFYRESTSSNLASIFDSSRFDALPLQNGATLLKFNVNISTLSERDCRLLRSRLPRAAAPRGKYIRDRISCAWNHESDMLPTPP